VNHQSTTQEGTALLIGKGDTVTGALAVETISGLEDPNEGQDGEDESRPVDEARGTLVIENGPQCPRDDESAREVTLNGRERVSSCGAL